MVGLDVSTSVDAEGLTVGLLVGSGDRSWRRYRGSGRNTVSTSVGLEVDTMSVGPWTVTRSECR